jgi:hypothetical protein
MSEKRPVFLSILTWLSFLGEGFGLLLVILSFRFSSRHSAEILDVNMEFSSESELHPQYQNIITSFMDFWIVQQDQFYTIHFSRIILLLTSLFGVYLMYNLKRNGFFIYTVAQVLLVAIPFLYVSGNPIGQIMASLQFFIVGLFVFLYATQVKYLT